MTSLSRWMRVVGALYLVNSAGLMVMYLTPAIQETLLETAVPGSDPTHPLARWGMEIWLMFALELLVIGVLLIVAARSPWANRILAVTVIGLELVRGVIDDLIWIINGYPPGVYLGWIAFHTLLIVTGVVSLERARRETADRELVPV